MKTLSEDLALTLIEHSALPLNIQNDLDYIAKEKVSLRMKGELRLFKIEDKYLYVDPDLFKKSLLKSIYGNIIDRTNEDSFDTLLCLYFDWYYYAASIKPTESEITNYIGGMDYYAKNNSIENLWHVLNLAKQCIEDSFHPNFSSLLSFYSLIELLLLKDIDRRTNGNYIHQECGRKLPYFYNKINSLSCPAINSLDKNLSETDIFENMTFLRHKVIHGIFNEARKILDKLFPISSVNGEYMGNTEDAESSAFQDQMQNLNMLIRSELAQILREWMLSPSNLSSIKNNINFR